MAGREQATLRWRWDIAYDGTDFHGWARQPGLRTVEQTVTDALRTVLHLPDNTDRSQIEMVCAGRTDSGVHARGQVAHTDLALDILDALQAGTEVEATRTSADARWDEVGGTLLRRMQGVLQPDVAVRAVKRVSADFDARFSALSRRYAYRIADTAVARDPLRSRDVLDHPRTLDLEAMNRAAEGLLGEHDFAAFCRPRPPATTVRTLLACSWHRDGAGRAVLDIRADAFCHSMVRAIVGALVAVGEGRRDPSWVHGVLAGATRDPGVRVMPASGLTLEEVVYPAPEDWAHRQVTTRTVRTPR